MSDAIEVADEPHPDDVPASPYKLTLRLTADERAALDAHAAAIGMTRSTWPLALIRAHLTLAPQFAEPEVAALQASATALRALAIALEPLEGTPAVAAALAEQRRHLARAAAFMARCLSRFVP